MDKKIIVAIDGHSSCGKSTMAKALAREVGYIYIDTGAMYRGVTLAALRAGLIDAEHIDEVGLEALLPQLRLSFRLNADGLPELYLGDERVEQEIRTMRVSNFVSPISAIPAVREALTKEQQRMGASKGVVMDGRDIGTNVFPEAELKIFVTADPKVRAQRRLLELREKGDNMTTLEEVLANVESRDYADSHRAVSPLRQAEDAVVLDNTHLTHQQQSQKLSELFAQAVERLG
ncbi:(d)CMP kinase [Porphyromonas sp. COT-290 OH3588]|uniref:(d)CMP kinase n=1 Tax=Porphyromonas sp. COT-290 OH3588 TaxID=1515617 RepID=UPI00052D6658|nr:(d)CMP kinase [Porphyromonas sp. COT-290 OH3588]KGN97862.1 cytidylate kinase [Porphyromonas sp. COT-290 OH3588]